MHRSATSLVAKGLYEARVHLGDRLLGAHASNPHGHYEDIEFIRLNDRLLHEAGGSWDNPPPEKEICRVGYKHRKGIQHFIELKQYDHELWGWKDPRTVLTIRCFEPFLTAPHYVSVFRSPEEVAASLQRRDGWTIEQGLKLAKEYNRRLVKFLHEQTGA